MAPDFITLGLWAAAAVVVFLRKLPGLAAPIVVGTIAAALASSDVVPEAAALVPGACLHLLLGLSDGALGTAARRAMAVAAYALGTVLVIVASTTSIDWPVTPGLVAFTVAVAVLGLPASNVRYRRAPAAARQRMQWLGCALVLLAEGGLVVITLSFLTDWPAQPLRWVLLLTAVVPVALMAGSGPRTAVRIDRVLAHVVSLGGLLALVTSADVFIVVGLGRLPEGGERSILLLSMLAAAIVAAVHPAAGARLTTIANRLVYGERTAPDEALRTFGARMTRAIPLDELLLQLAESLRKTFSLSAAAVWTGSDGQLTRTVSVPRRPAATIEVGAKELGVVVRAGVTGGTWIDIWLAGLADGADPSLLRVAPVAHGGELLGLLVLERRPESDLATEEDDRILADLARQVALALHNANLDNALQASLVELQKNADELQASRARIVTAGDSERRKLERDLHDGAQQQLVVLAVNLRLARNAIEDGDTDTATSMLDQLQHDVTDAVQELRALSHGIFPPLLASDGLGAALRAAAKRSSLATSLTCDGVGRYPGEIEAAVYFCCLEAMQNAGKHAGDRASVQVRVWQDELGLQFEVADDGAGFAVNGDGAGHGFVNMADRLGAFGGRVSVVSSPGGGTRISGRIPLADQVEGASGEEPKR